MRSFIKFLLLAVAITSIASCESKPAESTSTAKPLVDTTSLDAISDSVAPNYAEPDSVPGDTAEDKE